MSRIVIFSSLMIWFTCFHLFCIWLGLLWPNPLIFKEATLIAAFIIFFEFSLLILLFRVGFELWMLLLSFTWVAFSLPVWALCIPSGLFLSWGVVIGPMLYTA